MNEDRHTILEMLASGKINADEAERLLAALDKPTAGASSAGTEVSAKPRAKYLRVVVEDEGKKGPMHVNIRVPMQLLRAGVKLTSIIPPQAQVKINDALSHAQFAEASGKSVGGVIDLSSINPENLGEIVDQLEDLTLDVNDGDKAKVRLFCE